MGKLEWSMWANENALITSIVLLLGGILATAGQFALWQIGIYGIAIGIATFLIEYPRGKRQSGTSVERRFQKPITSLIRSGKLLTRNYFIRFLFYIVASVPCCFTLQTLIGGICLMVTSMIYLVAAAKGEEWVPIEPPKKEQGPKIIEQPTRPPPRRPDLVASQQPINQREGESEIESRI